MSSKNYTTIKGNETGKKVFEFTKTTDLAKKFNINPNSLKTQVFRNVAKGINKFPIQNADRTKIIQIELIK